MDSLERVLFAGNGFNCLDRNYVSWGELSKRLFKKFGVYDTYLRLFVENISPYMQYELLARAIQEKNGKFDEEDDEKIRQEIASLTSKSLHPSSVHIDAVKSFDQIITMNYDACFENAAIHDSDKIYPPSSIDKISKLKVSIPRERAIDGLRTTAVWHAHGAVSEKGMVNTLCMWFNTYIRNVGELKSELYPLLFSKKKSRDSSQIKKVVSEMQQNGSYSGKITSWVQLFFCANIDIIGTELSYDEIDVWWILSCRSKLIRQGVLPRGFNSIRYFMLKPYAGCKMSEKNVAKISLLKSMDVDIVFIDPQDYFTENRIFLSDDKSVNLHELASPPLHSDLYNTKWYYKKCMSIDIMQVSLSD